MAAEICGRLRFSNDETEQILALVDHHMRFGDVQRMKESTLKKFLRLPGFDEHLELHRIDCLSSNGMTESYEYTREKLRELPAEVIRPEPLITGRDLIEAGYEPGARFKEILGAVEDAQLEGQIDVARGGAGVCGARISAVVHEVPAGGGAAAPGATGRTTLGAESFHPSYPSLRRTVVCAASDIQCRCTHSLRSRSREVVCAESAEFGERLLQVDRGQSGWLQLGVQVCHVFRFDLLPGRELLGQAFSRSANIADCWVVGAASALSRALRRVLRPALRRARLRPSGVLRKRVPYPPSSPSRAAALLRDR